MVEIKFDVVNPNLHIVGDEIFFGLDEVDVVSAARSIDEAVQRHIGVLKVTETDNEVVRLWLRRQKSHEYTIPLDEFLHYQERWLKEEKLGRITNDQARAFGLSYIIDAQTVKNWKEAEDWRNLQRDLANPDAAFDEKDAKNLVYRVDRTKTLDAMKAYHQRLDPDIPDNFAGLDVFSPITAKGYIGRITFEQLKAKDKTKIEEAKRELAERLKAFKGPALSFEAPITFPKMQRLYHNAPELVQRYGIVPHLQDWSTKLFR